MRRTLRALVAACATGAGLLPAAVGAQAKGGYSPPPVPAPTYQTVSRYLTIPMDDGVRLGATITFPSVDGKSPAPRRAPVVFSMTPYGRDGLCGCETQTFYPSRGIVQAVVDVRGTGGSQDNLDGNYFSPREQRDGYDLVEYFGTQPWSSGRVGMVGGSYLAITQLLTAELRPPHLVAIAPDEALSDIYRDAFTYDGIPNLSFDGQYGAVQGAPGAASGDIGVGGDSGSDTDTNPADQAQGVVDTAGAKVDQAQSRPPELDYLERPNDDQWYHDRSPFYRAGQIQVPVLIIDGWRDGAFVRGDLEMYEQLARRRSVETRIDLNACTHKGCGPPFDPTQSSDGIDDVAGLEFDFMSHYLRGTPEHPAPPVHLYLQPSGPFTTASSWPPPQVSFKPLYLDPGPATGQPATGAFSVGTLGTRPATSGTASYFTDPVAGWSMALDSQGTIAASPYLPTDQRLEGEQGLTWRTPVGSRPLRIVGPVQLHLTASSTATDTDWVAKLSDVGPDGSQTVITEGALRASDRALDPMRSTPGSPYHLDDAPRPMVPGTAYPFDIAIIPTAYELAPGHSLQLRLTTDDMPTRLPGSVQLDSQDPSRSRVTPLPPAVNTVHESASSPSWLEVPIEAG